MCSSEAWWVNQPFDPEDPKCTRCQVPMQLTDVDYEWIDPPELNLCYECMGHTLEQAMHKLSQPVRKAQGGRRYELIQADIPPDPARDDDDPTNKDLHWFRELYSDNDYYKLFSLGTIINDYETKTGSPVDLKFALEHFRATECVIGTARLFVRHFDSGRMDKLITLFNQYDYVLNLDSLLLLLSKESLYFKTDREAADAVFEYVVSQKLTRPGIEAFLAHGSKSIYTLSLNSMITHVMNRLLNKELKPNKSSFDKEKNARVNKVIDALSNLQLIINNPMCVPADKPLPKGYSKKKLTAKQKLERRRRNYPS